MVGLKILQAQGVYYDEDATRKLAEFYFEVRRHDVNPRMFGLRDFFGAVHLLARSIRQNEATHQRQPMTLLLARAIARNFGGKPWTAAIRQAASNACISRHHDNTGRDYFNNMNPLRFVLDNLDEARHDKEMMSRRVDARGLYVNTQKSSRHIMIISKHTLPYTALVDAGIIKHGETLVVFGSRFPRDQLSFNQVWQVLNDIKLAAETGKTVVISCSSLFQDAICKFRWFCLLGLS